MKSAFKRVIITSLLILCTVFSAYSQDWSLEDLQNNMLGFSDAMAKSLPFNSSIGLNWSDAYIGKFFPSLPPHFGVGGSFGMTTMDITAIKGITDIFSFDVPNTLKNLLSDKMVFPAYALEARLGGLFLPFDIGAKFGMLPPVEWGKRPYDMRYTMAGADIRFALLDGKTKLFLPNLSLGIGVNYLNGGIGATIGKDTVLEFPVGTETHKLRVSSPEINLLWNTYGIDAKMQISKQILIITPYLGIAGGYSWSKAGYEIKTSIEYDPGTGIWDDIDDADIDNIKNYLSGAGLTAIDFDSKGFSSIAKNRAWNVRAFGGLSFNILILKIDLTAMYNILDSQFGGSVGVRIQL